MHSGKDQDEGDWEITPEGLYMATRGYLTRRGYCCANRCRNCPYINWCQDPHWQPIAPEYVQCTRVSPKAIRAAQALLHYHEQQSNSTIGQTQDYHQKMIEHYQLLLEHWKATKK